MIKKVMALFFMEISALLFQTNQKAITIKTYNVVQTGPNIQFGGLKLGLFKVVYQVGISLDVKYPEMPPMAKHTATLIKSLR